MTLIKFKPTVTRELLRDSMIPGHMMNLFDSFFNETASKFERNVFFTPRTDVVETAQSFEVHVSLPGVQKNDVQIEVEGDMLTISGERKMNNEHKSDKYHMVESFYGKFSRSFNLPENVDKQHVEASLNDGILRLTLPKVEVKDQKTAITIK